MLKPSIAQPKRLAAFYIVERIPFERNDVNEPNKTSTASEAGLDNLQGFDLKTAYEILIRAYVRNHLTLSTDCDEGKEEEEEDQ